MPVGEVGEQQFKNRLEEWTTLNAGKTTQKTSVVSAHALGGKSSETSSAAVDATTSRNGLL